MSNDIKIGSVAINDVKLGTNQVDKVYLGSTLVWELVAAFFDITDVTLPTNPVADNESDVTIYITNTETVAGTQDVTIQWRQGLTVRQQQVIEKTIEGSSSINFLNYYTFEDIGATTSDWTIRVITDDDVYTSSAFTVYELIPAYFNVYSIATNPNPVDVNSEITATIYVENTGNVSATKTVTGKWRRGLNTYETDTHQLTLGGGEFGSFTETYTPTIIDTWNYLGESPDSSHNVEFEVIV